MRMLRAVGSELLGLFVDDGALALALLLCCAVIGVAMTLAPWLSAAIAGPALLAGCTGILLFNVSRTGGH
ncbi:hypothetical protein [Plastoroseomonas hellenica]|uniref:hypothetical protein n=1 Tax=Plastoroseomonas hellenica TaxID=2687306 RepID=UPI001BA8EE1B|nr:hypothetical protein [Plastoroseomonas hellenica]MBR0641805.1 hypothetical protein [Plastoroseomonas hellenica]